MAIVLDKRMVNKPREKYWITYIKRRIKQNKNFLGFISGQTGSGKSWSSLSIAHDLDKDFNISRVVFSGIELMNLINSGDLKRGSVIVFEETGIEMNNRSWASITNKMLNYLIQTFRHKNLILIMNSPYMDFVDSATRKLFHSEFVTAGIKFKKKQCRLKPAMMQYNSRFRRMYWKRLRVTKREGKVPIDFWTVNKPSDDLIKVYEIKKRKFTDGLNDRIMDELITEYDKKDKKKPSELTDIQEDTLNMLQDGMTVPQIAIARGRAESVVHNAISLIKKKGYNITGVYEGSSITHYDVQDNRNSPTSHIRNNTPTHIN